MSETPRRELAVVIATHNRRQRLGRCLEALRAQSANPQRFQVVVADDGSTDGTAEMLAGLETPFELVTLRLEKSNKARALNAALRQVAAPACLFLDDDIVASPGLVEAHISARRQRPEALLLGRLDQRPPRRRDPYAQAAAVRWNRRYEELAERRADWADCYGANFSAPLEKLRRVGGFDEGLPAVEDLELGYRLARAGCEVVYLPAAGAVHDDEKPGGRILAHERRYGAWCARFAAEHPDAHPRLLGWFGDSTPREILLRRALLALRVPPAALVAAGRAIPGLGRRQVWFDFVSRFAFWHGVRGGSDRAGRRRVFRSVPVLMYHAFSEDGTRERYVMPRRAFARQMLALRLLRYRVIEFGRLADALAAGNPLPNRAAVITIDDGYADNRAVALPVLRRHRFPATLFLVSRRLGKRADWASDGGSTDGRPLLSAADAKRSLAAGATVGAHTRTHPSLPALPDPAVVDEVRGSRSDLEEALGAVVDTFAYPYGELDERSVEAARESGYRGACTTYPRHARFGDDPLLIPRVEIWGTDTLRRFLRKLIVGGQ